MSAQKALQGSNIETRLLLCWTKGSIFVRGIEKPKEVFIENFLLVPMLRVGTGLTLRDTSTLRDSTGLIGDV